MPVNHKLTLLQATRANRAAATPKPTATPIGSARVKAEPTSAAPSTSAKASKPGSSKSTGGGRDGYAVKQPVLDDDWEDELEEDTDQISKHGTVSSSVVFVANIAVISPGLLASIQVWWVFEAV